MYRKGVSGVVTAVLLILLVIAAIGIFWVVIVSFISDNAEDVGSGINSMGLEIDRAFIQGDNLYLKIKRDAQIGNLSKVRVVIEDSDGTESYDYELLLMEFEEKEIILDKSQFNGIDFSDIKLISVFPISNKGKVGKLHGDYMIGKGFVSESELVVYYSLESDAKDLSGNGNDGAIKKVGNVGNLGFVDGKFGQAAHFEGDCTVFGCHGQYIDMNGVIGSSYDVSYVFWIRTTHGEVYTGGGGNDFTFDDNWNAGVFGRRTGAGDILLLQMLRSGHGSHGKITLSSLGAGGSLTSASRISDGQWHFIAVVFDDTNDKMRMHVDGNPPLMTSLPSSDPFANTDPFSIGRRPNTNNYFNGDLDEFKIYNRALTTEEISYLYNYG